MLTVRDGKKVTPTCSECGCRLNIFKIEGMTFAHHYSHPYDQGRDAQGHTCGSIGSVISFESKRVSNVNGQ